MERKHIHETNPKRTAIALTLFVLVIIIGLITVREPRFTYALDPHQTVEMVMTEGNGFLPFHLEEVISGSNDTVILIDIRNKFQYGQGHIPGAENIAAITLLEDDNIKRLEQLKDGGMTIVIYGNNQLEANGPWMVFQQLGFDNVKFLYGGYNYYAARKDSLAATMMDDGFMKGTPRYDYAEVAASTDKATITEQDVAAPLTIKRSKKSAVAEGGC